MINWLPLSDRKNLDQVRVVYEYPTGQNYGGYYNHTKNIIVIVYNNDIRHEASILAHEYRHHIQRQLNIVNDTVIHPRQDIEYQRMIRRYFRTSPSEYDALLYQNKVAKSELSQEWLHWTVK
jgi:hypothetical protein